jgi:hypothetical protein
MTKRDTIPGLINFRGHRYEHYRSETKMGHAKKTKNMIVNKWKHGGAKEAAIIRVWEIKGRLWYCVYTRRTE